MAERNPPYVIHNRGDHPASELRLMLASLVPHGGVVNPNEGALEVTEKSTPDMSANVAAGEAFISGDESATQGTYHVVNDATATVTFAAADGTNPRIDLVVARVQDQEYSGSTDAWDLQTITGTAGASPSEPTVPNNAIVLARVDVPAGATSITNADITDRRERARVRGGGHVATVVFTASGTFDKADYPWLSRVRTRVVGGGGGGGRAGATGTGEYSAGGGGGGGGYAETLVDVVDLAASETVTVGAGGAANGGNGGASSFGAHAAAGGGIGGGNSGVVSSGTFMTGGGNPGEATAGDVLASGDAGGKAVFSAPAAAQCRSGKGGSSPLGGGRNGRAASQAGENGRGYGGGGSGAANAASQAQRDGGVGASGVVIVELYA